jgi:hypothetical protein
MEGSKKRASVQSSIIKKGKTLKRINHYVSQKIQNKVMISKTEEIALDYYKKRGKKVVEAKAIKVIKFIV